MTDMERIAQDMGINEGHPHGVPPDWDFYSSSVITMGNHPAGSTAIEFWGDLYIDAGGNSATNTLVNIRRCQLWWKRASTGVWTQGVLTDAPEVGQYAEDFSVDYGDITPRTEADGSISFSAGGGRVSHFFAPFPRIPIPATDIGGIVSITEARPVLNNPTGVDDRAIAHFPLNSGGDYYPDTTGPGIENNPGIGGGKFKYVSSAWNSFCFTTLSLDELNAAPPPVDFSGIVPPSGTRAGAVFHYQEEGLAINTTLVGLENGSLCLMSSGEGDMGNPIQCRIFTKAVDSGDPRSLKIYGDGWIKANTQQVLTGVTALEDDYETQVALESFSTTGISSEFIDLHGTGNLHRNLALRLDWESTSPDDATQEFYYWELNAWEVHPLTIQNWVSQPTTHGLNGFQHIREIWLAYVSTTGFSFSVTADGKSFPYTFPSSGGALVKNRIDTHPIKGKLFSYGVASSAPISMMLPDLEVRVKEWSSVGPYLPIKPFA